MLRLPRATPFRALIVALVLCSAVAGTANLSGAAGSARPAARYIVVLKDSVRDPSAVSGAQARAFGESVTFVYRHAMKGYAAMIPAASVGAVARDPRVAYVERDRAMLAVTTQTGATWASTGSTRRPCR